MMTDAEIDMVSLPRTCPKCGSSMLHYGACACQIPPPSLDKTVQNGLSEMREVAIQYAIDIVEECARLGLPYDRCLEHLRNFKRH